MNINNLFKVFGPKNDDFFPMLDETTALAVTASQYLKKMYETKDETERVEIIKLIKAIEVQGDIITAKIFKKLERTFITPFDREDIHKLTEEIESVLDHINYCAQKVLLYTPESLPECTVSISRIIHSEIIELELAIQDLKYLKKKSSVIKAHCKAIKKLEREADIQYQQGIISVFMSDYKPVEIIKLEEIIQELEKTANSVYSVSKAIKLLLVKYS